MIFIDTRYGKIKDAALEDYYPNGGIRRCIVRRKNKFNLACGKLIPQYLDDGKRKKLVKSMTFFENGNLESIILQETTPVKTGLGSIPAEMVSFYECGAIRRTFPSFGTISAFWTQKDEKEGSPALSLQLPFGIFHGKAINLMFYETGELRSMTLWPGDTIPIETPAGKIRTRIGFSLFRSGAIHSLEPQAPVPVKTPIGIIPAYNPDAIGIDGDKNSLHFTEDGSIKSLLTSEAIVTVTQDQGILHRHGPSPRKNDYFDDAEALEPMKVSFADGTVRFGPRKGQKAEANYLIAESRFQIEPFRTDGFRNICEECYESDKTGFRKAEG